MSKGVRRVAGRIRVSYNQRERLSSAFRGTGLGRRVMRTGRNQVSVQPPLVLLVSCLFSDAICVIGFEDANKRHPLHIPAVVSFYMPMVFLVLHVLWRCTVSVFMQCSSLLWCLPYLC